VFLQPGEVTIKTCATCCLQGVVLRPKTPSRCTPLLRSAGGAVLPGDLQGSIWKADVDGMVPPAKQAARSAPQKPASVPSVQPAPRPSPQRTPVPAGMANFQTPADVAVPG
jgi:hypothetical protein